MLNGQGALPYLETYLTDEQIDELKIFVFNKFYSDFQSENNRESIGLDRFSRDLKEFVEKLSIHGQVTDHKIEREFLKESHGYESDPIKRPIMLGVIYREHVTGKILSRKRQVELVNKNLEEKINIYEWYAFHSNNYDFFESDYEEEDIPKLDKKFNDDYDKSYEEMVSKNVYFYYLLQLSCKAVRFTYKSAFLKKKSVPQKGIASFVNQQRELNPERLKFDSIPINTNPIQKTHHYFNGVLKNHIPSRCQAHLEEFEIDRFIQNSEHLIKLAFPEENFDRFKSALTNYLDPIVKQEKRTAFVELGKWYICQKVRIGANGNWLDGRLNHVGYMNCLNQEIIDRHNSLVSEQLRWDRLEPKYTTSIDYPTQKFFRRKCDSKHNLNAQQIEENIRDSMSRCRGFGGNDLEILENLGVRIRQCLTN